MYAEHHVKSRRGKYAESLDYAEAVSRNNFHADSPHEHHTERDSRTDSVGAAVFAFCSGDYYDSERRYREKHDKRSYADSCG